MYAKNSEPKKIAKIFSDELTSLLGNNLKSVSLYGSIATGEFLPRKSNLNFLVVLENLEPLILEKLSERSSRWKRKFKTEPLFLTKKEIFEGLDAYPIEFLEMKDKHIIVYGENIFRNMKIVKKYLRLQCEHVLRGKLILLRQSYLSNRRAVKDILGKSINAIAILLRSVLYLKKETVPTKRAEIIEQACELFDLNPQPFLKALEIRNKLFFFKTKELHYVFQNYVEELKKLSDKIDKLKVR